jgi:hypothetical protein
MIVNSLNAKQIQGLTLFALSPAKDGGSSAPKHYFLFKTKAGRSVVACDFIFGLRLE